MKTFKDLEFKNHPNGHGKQARLDFSNGYGVSVITGDRFYYTSDSAPYEVAVFKDGQLCYNTPITDDVLGYQTKSGVTEIMKQVQLLKNLK